MIDLRWAAIPFAVATASCFTRPASFAAAVDVESRLLPARVRRLSNVEYERTVSDLVGKQERLAELLPPDVRQEGYTSNTAQGIPAAWATRLDPLISDVAARAASERLGRLAPCAATRSEEEACAREFVQTFGRRAYRRPLSSAELARLLRAFEAGAESEGGFAGGAELVLRAVLQSPNVLYASELGGGGQPGSVVTLTPYEIATALAYTLRGAPPDEELLGAAESGALLSPKERERQARRLLGMSDTRYHFRRFVLEWLEVDGLERTAKNVQLYPTYDELKPHMLAETSAFVDEVIVHGGASVRALLNAGFASVDPAMARFYGLPTFGPRAKLLHTRRAGILQHASFLSSHAHGDSTSPVKRGDFVMRRLLCNEVQRPAELGIEVVIPPVSATHTTRERFSAHVSDPSCRACHSILDGIGFTFEGFDAVGQSRTLENTRAVDTTGSSRLFGEIVRWQDSLELSRWLAERTEVAQCFSRQAFRYFSAQSDRGVEASFLEVLEDLPDARAGNLVEELVVYIQSDLFVKREVRR